MLIGLSAALIAAVLFGSASILQTMASRNVPLTVGLSHHMVRGLFRQPVFLAAVALNLSGFIFHLIALRTIPLFLAQSGIAVSLAVTALLATQFFDDPLGVRDWTAVGAVCLGLAVLAASAGDAGENDERHGFAIAVFAALGVLAVAGLVTSRFHGAPAAAALGLLAGFGFAGVSVSARLLPSLDPSIVVQSLATYSLAACGCVAFLLYSLALQRGTVTGATGPMIVAQTVTPAAIGVLLLHDAVRSGWQTPAVVSFALTAVGAVALARYEQTTP